MHGQASAQAGGSAFSCPAPGALVFSFPDGCPAEITTPKSMSLNPAFRTGIYVSESVGGDYPLGPSHLGSPANKPACLRGEGDTLAGGVSFGTYLWLKRAGPMMNIQDFLNMMNTNITPPSISTLPLMVSYYFDQVSGMIRKQVRFMSTIYTTNSENQLWLLGKKCIASESTAQKYDLSVFLNVCNAGNRLGGMHGGEPIVDSRLSQNPLYVQGSSAPPQNTSWATTWQSYLSFGWDSANGGWAFHVWRMGTPPGSAAFQWGYSGGDNSAPSLSPQPIASATGALRPTYATQGLAVEIALHKVINAAAYFSN